MTPEQQSELRDWIRGFGAWDDEELAAMSDQETNALLLQFIAGDIREQEHFDTIEEWEAACESGQCSGALCQGDGGRWYYYVGG